MVVNAMLGTVLWTAYAEAYSVIEPNMRSHPIMCAALSGGIAGGVQALIAAPAENARLAIEGGQSWIQAWKSLVQNNPTTQRKSRADQLRDAREFRKWMQEVGEMAGRGWNGWGWGCAKDICGGCINCDRSFLEIAVFAFSVFSIFLYLRSYEKGWSGC